MDRGTWWATVHGVAKSQTRLKQLSSQHNRTLLPEECKGSGLTISPLMHVSYMHSPSKLLRQFQTCAVG